MNQNKFEISIINENNYLIPPGIEEIVSSTLFELKINPEVSVSIIFIDEAEMEMYNHQYNGYAKSTDVLSFEINVIDPETGKNILGDIFICYPFVDKQSKSIGNALADELKLMVIHGMLHLLGYTHDTDEQKQKMWDVQSKLMILNEIKLIKMPE